MAAVQRNSLKESRLQTRLAARQQQLLATFQENVEKFSNELHTEQQQKLEMLKQSLHDSHENCTKMLEQELQRAEAHRVFLQKYEGDYAQATTSPTTEGATMEPLIDCYHGAGEGFAESKKRMAEERYRLVSMAVTLRYSYQERVETIIGCNEGLQECEERCRTWLQQALFDVILSMAKIGYSSVSASQVLAQRVIHSSNESFYRTHAAYKTLLLQLQSRELLKQRVYARQMALLYNNTLQNMERSSSLWAATLLHTDSFRRPKYRESLLQHMGKLIADMHRDGVEFLNNIGCILQSLRRARDPLPNECGQTCGGTMHDGWLRGFDGGLFSPVFVPSAPEDVTVEWRVKANVLVRHAIAQGVLVMNEVQEAEEQLRQGANAIYTQLAQVLRWIHEPDPETGEALSWATASLQERDAIYIPFTTLNSPRLSKCMAANEALLTPLLVVIQAESDWFVTTVDEELCRCQNTLESILLTDSHSVLQMFDGATKKLGQTVEAAVGFTRSRLVTLYEARKDHEDNLRYLEEEFTSAQMDVQIATTPQAAEKYFVEGLKILDRINVTHRTFHRNTVEALQQLESEGVAVTEQQCKGLLRLLGLESESTRAQRLKEERIAAAMAAAEAAAKKSRGKEAKTFEEFYEEMEEAEEEAEQPNYPTIVADDGELYLVVSATRLVEHGPGDGHGERSERSTPHSRTSTPKGRLRKTSKSQKAKVNQQSATKLSGNKRRLPMRAARQHGHSDSEPPPAPQPSTSPAFVVAYRQLLDRVLQEQLIAEEGQPGGQSEDTNATGSSGNVVIVQRAQLSTAAVDEWREMLRREVLNWTVHLRQTTAEYLRKQCLEKKLEVDAETNEALRRNRRRPAALQAGTYELRVRELQCTIDSIGKQGVRIRHMHKRLLESCRAALNTEDGSQDPFSQDDSEVADAKLFAELEKLQGMIPAATSVGMLTGQERIFSNLISTALEQREAHYSRTIGGIVQQGDALEQSIRSYLRSFAVTLPADIEELRLASLAENAKKEAELAELEANAKGQKKGGDRPKKKKGGKKSASKEAVEEKANKTEDEAADGAQGEKPNEMIELLLEALNEIERVKQTIAERREIQIQRVEEARARYMAAFQQNIGEMETFSQLQELIARLKLQVHSLIVQSEAKEAKIDSMLKELEELTAEEPTLPAFTNKLKGVLNGEWGDQTEPTSMGSRVTSAEEFRSTSPKEGEVAQVEKFVEDSKAAEQELPGLLSAAVADLQSEVRGSEVVRILKLLDKMRTRLYARGRLLDCLQNGIELFNVPQDRFVEAQSVSRAGMGTDEARASNATPSPNQTPPVSRPQRRSRANTSALKGPELQYPPLELPEVKPIAVQMQEWKDEMRTQATSLLEPHFASFPPPLLRRLPGMTNGEIEDVLLVLYQQFDGLEQRSQQHVKQAVGTYREQIERLNSVLKKVPAHLVASTYQVSARALERRVKVIMEVFLKLHDKSNALRRKHEGSMRTTLASNANFSRMHTIRDAENMRQAEAQRLIENFWVLVQREVDEEASMHSGRNISVNNSFFAIMRGIVTPQHLKPPSEEPKHKGLRRLLQLKAQLTMPTPRRERRLQETMPRHAHNAGKGAANADAAGKSSEPQDTTKGPLPLLQIPDKEYNCVIAGDSQKLQLAGSGVRVSPDTTTIAIQGAAGTSAKPNQAAIMTPSTTSATGLSENERQGTVSVTIVGPGTKLHKEAAELTLRSVDLFNQRSVGAGAVINGAFRKWTGQEEMCSKVWKASFARFRKSGGSTSLFGSSR